jgi:hypothetical protein
VLHVQHLVPLDSVELTADIMLAPRIIDKLQPLQDMPNPLGIAQLFSRMP